MVLVLCKVTEHELPLPVWPMSVMATCMAVECDHLIYMYKFFFIQPCNGMLFRTSQTKAVTRTQAICMHRVQLTLTGMESMSPVGFLPTD